MLSESRTPDSGDIRDGLGRDPVALLTGAVLIAVAGLAWAGVIHQAGAMAGGAMGGPEMSMPMGAGAMSPAGALGYLGAWGVMMAAMMLPSAAPMIALYGAIRRGRGRTGQRGAATALFALVYLAVWAGFGIPVYLASLAVDHVAMADPSVAHLLPYGVAVTLVVAGVYQLTPLKEVCLRACRSPFGFLMSHWRSGYGGTLRMALAHALYCVGCCWALMVVLVAAGAMSLAWVLLIAAIVFVEKLLPRGERSARVVGGALLFLGALVAIRPDLAGMLRT